jgi:hypothetical protein
MNLTHKGLVTVAAALSAIAVVAPVSSASAATAATPNLAAFQLPAAGWGGLPGATGGIVPVYSIGFVGPSVGQVAAVIGPTIITTAPSTFINTNNQVSAGGVASGGQGVG